MTVLLVFCGGGVGAVLRYLGDRAVTARTRTAFPVGTLLVNVIGCLLLGIVSAGVARQQWSSDVAAFIGTGLCGGLTTFSTFAVESTQLARTRQWLLGGIYVLVSGVLGIGAAALGWQLG